MPQALRRRLRSPPAKGRRCARSTHRAASNKTRPFDSGNNLILTMTILDSCRRPDALAQAFNSYWRLAGVRSLVAVMDGTRSLSYGELDQHTAHLAAQLRAHGVAPGDAVAVTMRRSLDAVLAVIAAIRAGACPCLMEPRLPAAEGGEG